MLREPHPLADGYVTLTQALQRGPVSLAAKKDGTGLRAASQGALGEHEGLLRSTQRRVFEAALIAFTPDEAVATFAYSTNGPWHQGYLCGCAAAVPECVPGCGPRPEAVDGPVPGDVCWLPLS